MDATESGTRVKRRPTKRCFTDPANPPATGPFAVATWCESSARWSCPLTDAGRQFLAAFLANRANGVGHGRNPLFGLFRSTWPAVCRRAMAAGATPGEIDSACADAALRAMETFDPKAGADADPFRSFVSYLAPWMYHKVVIYEQFLRRGRGYGADGDDDTSLIELAVSNSDDKDRRSRELREAILSHVPDSLSRSVFAAVHGLGTGYRTFNEAAKEFGYPRQRVSKLEVATRDLIAESWEIFA